MTVRERLEQAEYDMLAPQAQKAAESKGRAYADGESELWSQKFSVLGSSASTASS